MSGDEENENPTDSLDSASWQEHKEIHNVTVIGTRGGGGGGGVTTLSQLSWLQFNVLFPFHRIAVKVDN